MFEWNVLNPQWALNLPAMVDQRHPLVGSHCHLPTSKRMKTRKTPASKHRRYPAVYWLRGTEKFQPHSFIVMLQAFAINQKEDMSAKLKVFFFNQTCKASTLNSRLECTMAPCIKWASCCILASMASWFRMLGDAPDGNWIKALNAKL